MSFATLAYAKFFALVFVAAWLAVQRRFTPLLPWLGLFAYVAFTHTTPVAAGIVAIALGLSTALCRGAGDEIPPLRVLAASVAVNFGGLAWLTHRTAGRDPLGLALSTLGVPIGHGSAFTLAGLVLAPLGLLLLLRARKLRLLLLLGASWIFYAEWDWRFLPLIWGSSTADWLLGRAISRAGNARKKKLWLAGTVVVNLGVLGVFKYFDFGVESVTSALTALGYHPSALALHITLPIGISFFTFESMSYVIDVYRGTIQPQKSYVEYLAFVAFFPHLVAGPIVRPRDLLPQLAGPPRWSSAEGSEGLFLISIGLVKKLAIGDYLALNLVDRVFDAPAQYSALECYAAVLGYAVQIYSDFSGYTDIAIGSALLLGVRFPKNFDAPYKAASIQEFWRRWHISLSTWLRDYLYVPLGGNRRGRVRTYVNLLLTMLLGGLWHGASWTFVAWGGLHGAALAVDRWVSEWRGRKGTPRPASPLVRVLGVLLTFHFVCACWIFFRADSFGNARTMFVQLATLTHYAPRLTPTLLAVLAAGLVSHFVPERWYDGARDAFARMPAPVQGVALFAVAVVIRRMAAAEAVPFVYFQF